MLKSPATDHPADTQKPTPETAGAHAEQQQLRRRTAIRIIGIEGLEAFPEQGQVVPPRDAVKPR